MLVHHMNNNDQNNSLRMQIEKAVIAFVLAYGLHYFAYFLRSRYYTWLGNTPLDEGVAHVLLYLGHLYFFVTMTLYALAVRKERKYVFALFKGKLSNNLKYGLFGALLGFAMMGICVLAASFNGNITITPSADFNVIFFIFAIFAVFIQASAEEIESRSLIYQKLSDQGVSVKLAIFVSSFFFAYLHTAKPGFGIIPLLTLFFFGVQFALACYYFKNIWFACGAHMMWNFSQDFIFGLPNSGTPATVSLFGSVANSSGFFYDQTFGIEGSLMAVLVCLIGTLVIVLIGKKIRKDPDQS